MPISAHNCGGQTTARRLSGGDLELTHSCGFVQSDDFEEGLRTLGSPWLRPIDSSVLRELSRLRPGDSFQWQDTTAPRPADSGLARALSRPGRSTDYTNYTVRPAMSWVDGPAPSPSAGHTAPGAAPAAPALVAGRPAPQDRYLAALRGMDAASSEMETATTQAERAVRLLRTAGLNVDSNFATPLTWVMETMFGRRGQTYRRHIEQARLDQIEADRRRRAAEEKLAAAKEDLAVMERQLRTYETLRTAAVAWRTGKGTQRQRLELFNTLMEAIDAVPQEVPAETTAAQPQPVDL